ncbi:MAG: lysine biosynthesis protein LysX [Sulfolobaceae archaeon]|nr:lysine biosynthesis protein LysX [Sulfolobaceae archaeon]
MKVALVVDIVRPEEKQIAKELDEKKISYDVINVNQVNLPLKKGLYDYQVAVIRTVSMYKALYAAAVLEAADVHTINSSYTIYTCGDKILAYSKLLKANVPIPYSIITMSPDTTLKAYEELGYPLVDKPPIGSWGRMVSLIRDVIEGKTIIEHREMLSNSQLKIHIVQEYVKNKGRDIRCLVLGNKLLGCYARKIPPNDWRANVALGGIPESIDVNKDLEKIALAAAKTVNGEFVSIDILEHENKGYIINEINDVPEFKGFMAATKINVPKELVEYIISNYLI